MIEFFRAWQNKLFAMLLIINLKFKKYEKNSKNQIKSLKTT